MLPTRGGVDEHRGSRGVLREGSHLPSSDSSTNESVALYPRGRTPVSRSLLTNRDLFVRSTRVVNVSDGHAILHR
jgi:hypothetical protein